MKDWREESTQRHNLYIRPEEYDGPSLVRKGIQQIRGSSMIKPSEDCVYVTHRRQKIEEGSFEGDMLEM